MCEFDLGCVDFEIEGAYGCNAATGEYGNTTGSGRVWTLPGLTQQQQDEWGAVAAALLYYGTLLDAGPVTLQPRAKSIPLSSSRASEASSSSDRGTQDRAFTPPAIRA